MWPKIFFWDAIYETYDAAVCKKLSTGTEPCKFVLIVVSFLAFLHFNLTSKGIRIGNPVPYYNQKEISYDDNLVTI